jgi:hypothetical protein
MVVAGEGGGAIIQPYEKRRGLVTFALREFDRHRLSGAARRDAVWYGLHCAAGTCTYANETIPHF